MSASDPLKQLLAITPDDTNNLPFVCRAVWVGTAGDLSVRDTYDVTTIIPNATVGWHPLILNGINDTGTAAGDIVIGR